MKRVEKQISPLRYEMTNKKAPTSAAQIWGTQPTVTAETIQLFNDSTIQLPLKTWRPRNTSMSRGR